MLRFCYLANKPPNPLILQDRFRKSESNSVLRMKIQAMGKLVTTKRSDA